MTCARRRGPVFVLLLTGVAAGLASCNGGHSPPPRTEAAVTITVDATRPGAVLPAYFGGYPQYRDAYERFRTAIQRAAPGVAISGPETAGQSWLAGFAGDERAELALLTTHFYPLTRCGGSHPTIADLLGADATPRA